MAVIYKGWASTQSKVWIYLQNTESVPATVNVYFRGPGTSQSEIQHFLNVTIEGKHTISVGTTSALTANTYYNVYWNRTGLEGQADWGQDFSLKTKASGETPDPEPDFPVIVPECSASIIWKELDQYPGDSYYNYSTITSKVGTWDKLYWFYPCNGHDPNATGDWEHLVPNYGWTSARCFMCYKTTMTSTKVTVTYSIWYTGYNYANYPYFYYTVRKDADGTSTQVETVATASNFNEASQMGDSGYGWNLANNIGRFQSTIEYTRQEETVYKNIYFEMGNNGGSVSGNVMSKWVMKDGSMPIMIKGTKCTATAESNIPGVNPLVTSGSISGTTIKVNSGSSVTWSVDTSDVYDFIGWYNTSDMKENGRPKADATRVSANRSYTRTISDDLSLTAVFNIPDWDSTASNSVVWVKENGTWVKATSYMRDATDTSWSFCKNWVG